MNMEISFYLLNTIMLAKLMVLEHFPLNATE